MGFTKKFYTADLHFGHALMVDPRIACVRPWASTDEMDAALIERWNAVVGDDDIAFIIGDFSFGLGNAGRIAEVFSALRGRKRLVIGNHDVRRDGSVHPTIDGLAWDQPPRDIVTTTDQGQHVVMCHYPLRVWPRMKKGSWNFHGHLHSRDCVIGRSRDVGVDSQDVGYAPRTFRQLTASMNCDAQSPGGPFS